MASAHILRSLLATIFIAIFLGPVFAQAPQPVPALTARVLDQSTTLSQSELAALEARLASFEQERGTQIAVLLVLTTAPEDIASYANRVANDWKIGRRGVGDGLLLVVAKQDRKLRIEVSKTLEGAIPDLAARQIIDRAITPLFKQGRYAEGIDAGLSQLFARVRGEALPLPAANAKARANDDNGFDWTDLGIFLFFAVPVGSAIARAVFGRFLGTLAVGGSVGTLAFLFTQSAWLALGAGLVAMLWGLVSSGASGHGGSSGGWSSGSSSSGSSSDSGGFSSGGGGDFGGGGASGDW